MNPRSTIQRSFLIGVAASALTSIVASTAVASPFDPSQVSSEAKWVVHVDMDRLRDGELWKSIEKHIQNDDQIQNGIADVATFSGMHFPQDLHDFTVFGNQSGDDAGTVMIHAHFDRNGTLGLLQMNPDFSQQPFNGHDVLTWTDKGKTNFGAFYDDTNAIVGHSVEQVEAALTTLDDKTKGLKSTDSLANGAANEQGVYIGVRDFPALQKPDASPVIRKIDSGWIGLIERADGVHLNAMLATKDEPTAQQLNNALNGLIAVVGMMSGSPRSDARVNLLNEAIKTCTLSRNGTSVLIDWPVPSAQVTQAVDQIFAAREKAKNASNP